MADKFSAFKEGDPQLKAWQEELLYGNLSTKRKEEIEKLISARTMALAQAAGIGSYYLGSAGQIRPNYAYSTESGPEYASLLAAQEELRKALANQSNLEFTGTKGLYSKSYYGPQGTLGYRTEDGEFFDTNILRTVDISKPNKYTSNKKEFYDASGRQLSPAEVAKTEQGQAFANAGWDIGFGPGVLPEGTVSVLSNTGSTNITSNTTGNRLGNGTGDGSGTASTGLTASDVATQARRSAQQEFRAALTDMGLADLADVVDEMIKQDFTTAQIRLDLPKTQAYALRFPGMKALRDAKQAISEATYISMEKGYLQTLGAYGLDASVLGSREQLGKYIANLVSPREFEERVDLAATRVKENPDLITQFKVFYPEVDNSALTAYLLDPSKGMDIIKKQVRTAEIGAASVKAGFGTTTLGTSAAEALIGATGTSNYAALSQSFARAKELATQQSRLARIENANYNELEAIGAVVGGDITKTLASQARAEREISRFAGRGGLSTSALRSTGMNI
jgi:hypothetical protein